jgi:RNA:NAD 2'-phosphotransferase (TPT1/KptA family)
MRKRRRGKKSEKIANPETYLLEGLTFSLVLRHNPDMLKAEA